MVFPKPTVTFSEIKGLILPNIYSTTWMEKPSSKLCL